MVERIRIGIAENKWNKDEEFVCVSPAVMTLVKPLTPVTPLLGGPGELRQ